MNFDINIVINGKTYHLTLIKHITIQQIVKLLYGNNQGIVLEHNKKIITAAMWDKIYIESNDRIEILTIVGGG